MLALHYRRSVPRFIAAKLVGKRYPSIVTGVASAIHLEDVPEPKLPTAQWVRVRPLLSGVCGSDVAVITAEGTPYLSELVSFPFVPGHELVGEIADVGGQVSGLAVGQRVVLEPALGCRVRGFAEPCAPCRSGYYAACERVMDGDISSGIQTGFCRDTGGGWGPSLVAHHSQLYPVPDAISNEAAVLVEPLACAVHAALRAKLAPRSRVLVLGCGTIGLLTIAALRAFAPECTIVAVAKYPHQQALAKELGAQRVLGTGGLYQRLAEMTGAKLLKLPWGKPNVLGGVDASFVCIGSASAWEDALRWTRARGTVVMVGMPGEPRADLTPLWYKELAVLGAYAYGAEQHGEGQMSTFQLALDMLARQGWGERLAQLVRHKFPLSRYREAFATAMHAGKHESVKVVFDLTG
ncbi:MAG: alcohol dehydrogenase [Dehalococcoidia bacterium]|nr:alcohol dehydrogenase [Dehalococcoidia bacterium]